jgi:hypothetical protein
MKTTSVMLCVTLASGLLIGTLLLNHQQQASAQMGMMNPNMMNRTGMMGTMANNMMNPNMMGNMMTNPNMMGMGSMMNLMFGAQNITSSIKLLPAMMNGVHSQIKLSLSDAVMIAQKQLGNNSQAVAAHVADEHGYLVYAIWGVDPDMNLHKVIIDPGNGKVLFSQKLPMLQMMDMMGGMMNPGMMGGMMNPGMMGGMMNPGMMGGMMNPGMMSNMWH